MDEGNKAFSDLKSYLRLPHLLVKPSSTDNYGLCSELDASEVGEKRA